MATTLRDILSRSDATQTPTASDAELIEAKWSKSKIHSDSADFTKTHIQYLCVKATLLAAAVAVSRGFTIREVMEAAGAITAWEAGELYARLEACAKCIVENASESALKVLTPPPHADHYYLYSLAATDLSLKNCLKIDVSQGLTLASVLEDLSAELEDAARQVKTKGAFQYRHRVVEKLYYIGGDMVLVGFFNAGRN